MKQERVRILKLVEEGKLTVEQALTLLEELEKEAKATEQKQTKIETALSTYVQSEPFTKHQQKEDSNVKFQSAKEKIVEFVDTAFKKLKEMDIDLNFGKSIELAHIFQQESTGFKHIDLHIAHGSVVLQPWEQADVRIECQAKVYRVETLEQAQETFLQGVNFRIENGRLNFQTQHKWMKVDAKVFVPYDQYEKVRIHLFNGAITAEQLMVKELKVDTANGRISLEKLKCDRVKAETANGRIKVKKSYLKELDVETINGAIKFDGELGVGKFQSFNGNIICELDGMNTQSLHAKATTGSVQLHIPANVAVSGDLKSNLGGIHVKLDGIQMLEEKNEVVQKQLRFKTIRETERVLHITSETKTGSITIEPR